MRTKKFIIPLVCFAFLLTGSGVMAATLSVGSVEVAKGGELSLPITVSEQSGIAGAAFTLEFDTDVFTNAYMVSDVFNHDLTVYSSYDAATMPAVPIVDNPVASTGIRVAAASPEAVTATGEAVLFTLKATVPDTVDATGYEVKLVPTVLDNASAGYDPAGEQVDLLIGIDGETYPVLLKAPETDSEATDTFNPDAASNTGTVTVSSGVTVALNFVAGLNLISFPLSDVGITTAAELDAAIVADNAGVSVSQIFGWDAENQRFGTPYANLGGGIVTGDFNLEAGAAYFVQASGGASISLTGSSYADLAMYQALNMISVPPAKSSIVNASDFDADLANVLGAAVSQIFGWDAANQRFATPYANLGGGIITGDFELSSSEGYFVQVSQGGTYNP